MAQVGVWVPEFGQVVPLTGELMDGSRAVLEFLEGEFGFVVSLSAEQCKALRGLLVDAEAQLWVLANSEAPEGSDG